MTKNIDTSQYLRLLENWLEFSRQDIYTPPGRDDLECYGTGYNSWGVQTNQKAVAAWAVVAQAANFAKKNSAISAAEAREHALKMLRFSLESHLEGSFECLDGSKWGHTWISALGTERMMNAVETLIPAMSEQEQSLLRRVLISECDWLLNEYPVVAAEDGHSGKNRPESNLWNGAILHRTAMMYPDAPHASEYQQKGTKFLLNSISVPGDAVSKEIFAGRPLSEWHVGANFFETYALHHHAYLNVGYMVICLSNIAMLHFSFKHRGLKAPESLYHHAFELWQLIKHCTFPDGRLCRIGGDTRARYCYCQDYALPMWLLVLDLFEDHDCLDFEKSWLDMLLTETSVNGDGSFLGERGKTLKNTSPYYYTRLESDRAATISMALQWRQEFGFSNDKTINTAVNHDKNNPEQNMVSGAITPPVSESNPEFVWHDGFHGACLHRDENRLVSWVWEAAEKPQGLCLPTKRSDLAEWKYNLFPRIEGTGNQHYNEPIRHTEKVFPGGFLTYGSAITKSSGHLGEGRAEEIIAEQELVFAALPDGVTTLCIQYAVAPRRVYLSSIRGLNLNIPNDIFNGSVRTYRSAGKEFHTASLPVKQEIINLNSRQLEIEGIIHLKILNGDNPVIYRPAKRSICLLNKERGGGFLYVDEICSPCNLKLNAYEKNSILVDTSFVIRIGENMVIPDKSCSPDHHYQLVTGDPDKIRTASATGADGARYLLVANFASDRAKVRLNKKPGINSIKVLSSEEPAEASNVAHEYILSPKTSILLKIDN